MTDSEHRSPRRVTDLRVMRGSTAATLGVAVLVGAAMQLLVGVNPPLSARVVVLVVLTAAASLVALATIPLLLRSPGGPGTAAPHHPLVVALVLLALGVWAVAVVPPFAGWGWAFTLAIAGGVLTCVVRGWWKLTVVLGTYAVMALGGLLGTALAPAASITPPTTDSATDAVLIGTLVLFTLMPLSAVWVLQVVLRFEEARRMASELAVAKERLRFATDLHDIQGHHLQVIALKSELAERLMAERPDAARVEIADIRVIAQEALDDTRAVVNDYRSVTVAVEARNAASVLRSAGIHCEARLEASELPPAVGAVFAVAIREAATNVLRHSTATEASIELVRDGTDAYRLTVTNNAPGPRRPGGTGLTGLAERVAAQHGTVETNRTDDAFTLIVRVPVASHAHREEHSR